MQEHLGRNLRPVLKNLTGLVAISFDDDNIDKEVQDLQMMPLLIGLDLT